MVDEKGKIKNRKIVNTEIQVQTEIARILNQIPNMEPATYNGKEVGVIYTFPIVWGTKE
ncbi:hypothetical protein [Aquimarina spongiae]|uniref:TonB protein C-terminal n=1 Tax=Aquimarina spongiae TaxID=570521 RepID=A0A1M6I4C1_9FLAO|nr:hypothetical protein [Aquimarina spongiae]SHJ29279.1 hypothetical protein SAMN04488508_107108 [Aquimarina spongiae]